MNSKLLMVQPFIEESFIKLYHINAFINIANAIQQSKKNFKEIVSHKYKKQSTITIALLFNLLLYCLTFSLCSMSNILCYLYN